MHLMQDSRGGDDEADRWREEFWGLLDQRLHNMVSAAVSVVDLTRGLIDFYPHEPAFTAEWAERSAAVASAPRTQFLRKLRNYLLHFGMAPTMQTMSLAKKSADEWDDLTIQLSAEGLLRFNGWNATHRKFILSFNGGPPLRQVTVEYAEAMMSLYGWLLGQYKVLHVPGQVPAHLYPEYAKQDGPRPSDTYE